MASGTIQLPSELYWISPPFKIGRQISFSPALDHRGRITLLPPPSDSLGASPLLPALLFRALQCVWGGKKYTEHCGILRLKLCIFKAKIDPKRCIIFSTAFFLQFERERERKTLCALCVRVCVCYLYSDLYYVAVLYIVLSKHYMIMV